MKKEIGILGLTIAMLFTDTGVTSAQIVKETDFTLTSNLTAPEGYKYQIVENRDAVEGCRFTQTFRLPHRGDVREGNGVYTGTIHVIRHYNDQVVYINGKGDINPKTLSIASGLRNGNYYEFTDTFRLSVSNNQAIYYEIIYDYRESGEGRTDEFQTNRFNCNIFPKPQEPESQFENLTTHSGKERNFSYLLKADSGNPNGWHVKWTYDSQAETDSPTYILHPTLPTGTNSPQEKKLSVKITNLAPDGKTEWYTLSKDFTIKVYPDPSFIFESISQNKDAILQYPKGAATHMFVGQKENASDRKALFTLDLRGIVSGFVPENYGKWHYTWRRSHTPFPASFQVPNETIADEPATFTPSQPGMYDTEVVIRCVNPDDENEVWATTEGLKLNTLHVYKDPNDVDVERFIKIPSGADAYTYAGRNKKKEYSVNIENEEQYGRWIYKWTRSKDGSKQDISQNDASFIPSEAGTYTHDLAVQCVNPADEKDIWTEFKTTGDNALNVYENPNSIVLSEVLTHPAGAASHISLGTSPDEHRVGYEVSIPDAEKYGTWVYKWTRALNGKNESNLADNPQASFVPNEAGEFRTTLALDCVNPQDPTESWLEDASKYTFEDTVHVYSRLSTSPTPVIPRKASLEGDELVYSWTDIPTDGSGSPVWIFEWSIDAVKHESELPSYTIPTEKDIVVKGTWKNVNPADHSIVWETGSTENIAIKVYPQITKNWFGTLATSIFHAGQTITLPLELEGGNTEGWHCTPLLDGKEESTLITYNSENKEITYEPDEIEGKEPTTPVISALIANLSADGDTLFSQTIRPNETLKVFPAPRTTSVSYHYNKEDTNTSDYSIYTGNTFDVEKLFQIEGGFTDGWTKTLKAAKAGVEKPAEGLTFTPSETGQYELVLTLKNVADLGNGKSAVWHNEATTIHLTVYRMPTVTSNISTLLGNEEVLNVVNGHTSTLELERQNGSENNWNITWTKEAQAVGNGLRYEYTAENTSTGEPSSVSETISYVITNTPEGYVMTDDGRAPFSQTESITYIVWNRFTTVLSDNGFENSTETTDDGETLYVMETYEGHNEEISLKPVGPAEGWTYEWREESRPSLIIGNGSTLNLTGLSANADSEQTYKYKVVATFNKGKNDSVRIERTFKVTVYPRPRTSQVDLTNFKNKEILYKKAGPSNLYDEQFQAVICYKGDSLILKPQVKGGKPGMWKYKLSSFNNNSLTWQETVPETTLDQTNPLIAWKETDGVQKLVEVFCKRDATDPYYSSENEWINNIAYYVGPKTIDYPDVNQSFTDSTATAIWGKDTINVYEGETLDLRYIPEGGVDATGKGWNFEWAVDDTLSNIKFTSESVYSYNYVVPQPAADASEKHMLYVRIKNSIKIDENNEITGLQRTYGYPIRIWRRAEMPSDFILSDGQNSSNLMIDGTLHIREGNTLGIRTDKNASYGYMPNGFTYIWTPTNNYDPNNWSVVASNSQEDKTMGQSTTTYSLEVTNMGPYGKPWAGMKKKTHTLIVYNKPQTPKTLVKKGDGSSRTMICTTEMKDNELQSRDYYLVFGYFDSNNTAHDFASVKQVGSQTRWSAKYPSLAAMNSAYVYALWKYEDGSEVTSGIRYANGTSDETWDTSSYNGTTRAAIADLNPTAIEQINKTENRTSTRIFASDGTFVGAEKRNLRPGFYIIESQDTNGRITTKKIVIK